MGQSVTCHSLSGPAWCPAAPPSQLQRCAAKFHSLCSATFPQLCSVPIWNARHCSRQALCMKDHRAMQHSHCNSKVCWQLQHTTSLSQELLCQYAQFVAALPIVPHRVRPFCCSPLTSSTGFSGGLTDLPGCERAPSHPALHEHRAESAKRGEPTAESSALHPASRLEEQWRCVRAMTCTLSVFNSACPTGSGAGVTLAGWHP